MRRRSIDRIPTGIGAWNPLTAASLVVLMVSTAGLITRWALSGTDLVEPEPGKFNVFYFLFYRHEEPFLWLLFFAALFALSLFRFGQATEGASRIPRWGRFRSFLVAVGTLLIARFGMHFVLHDYGLSMDEFGAEFQSAIMATGRLWAPIPPPWRPFVRALAPVFVVNDGRNVWYSSYLPVYAGMRALFLTAHLERWLNPLLACLSVLLIDRAARELWPGDEARRSFAVLALATSSQFLLMSMTEYSYPAHLCLNLLWLVLYLRFERAGDARAFFWLPWIGALALGLHNPLVHALFVAPFLPAMARRVGWGRRAYLFGVYAAGALLWWGWLRMVQRGIMAAGPPGSAFGIPGRPEWTFQSMNLALVLSWQTPVVAILLAASFFLLRRAGSDVRLLAAGSALTFGFFLIYLFDQQHGWGYRYVYGVLGNFCLLATFAFGEVVPASQRWLAAPAMVVLAAVGFPLRAMQAEHFVRPFAAAAALIRRIDAPAVIVDPRIAWYAQDLIRNDPLLRRQPRIFSDAYLSSATRRRVAALPGPPIHVLDGEELVRIGWPRAFVPARPTDGTGSR